MMDWVAQIIVWVNVLANALGTVLLAPMAAVPGWLSNTIVSMVTGTLLLIAFKYTSNQKAIAKTKNGIKANLLSIKLFKDSVRVALHAEIGVLKGSLCLIVHSLRPMSLMIVPVSLLLAQLGLWYQRQPLSVGEEAVVTVTLHDSAVSSLSPVTLKPTPAIDVLLGPVRVISRGEVCWTIKARERGHHDLTFSVHDVEFAKSLAIGPGFMRVSPVRPGRHWAYMLKHPAEPPLPLDSVIQSIEINYPERTSWGASTDSWLIFFFGVTTLFAWVAGPGLKVKF
jgi:hypothetical protein